MATVITPATVEERDEAFQRWAQAQRASADWIKTYTTKNGNPFIPWPPSHDKITAFLTEYYNAFGYENVANVIEAGQLKELVETFDKHATEDRARRDEELKKAREYIASIKEKVKERGGNQDAVIDTTQSPEFVQTIETRVNEPIASFIEDDVSKQGIKFIKTKETGQPTPEIQELTQQLKMADALFAKLSQPPSREPVSFTQFATSPAALRSADRLDRMTAGNPGLREAAINNVIVEAFHKTIDKLGTEITSQPWFQEFLKNSQQIVSQPKPVGAQLFIKDLAQTIFGPAASESWVAYIELYRMNVMQGLPPPSMNQFRSGASGVSSLLFQVAADKAKNTIIRKGVSAIATKVGAGTLVGGPVGTAAGLILSFAGPIINRAKAILQRLSLTGGKVPGDWMIGCVIGILIVFAVLIAPLLFLFSQIFTTDASLAVRLAEGGIGGTVGVGINCTDPANKNKPDCQLTQCTGNCAWPLDTSTHACIIEGPYAGTHSACRLSAIDFAGPGLFGAQVHSPYAGHVTAAVFGYLDNTGYFGNKDGGTYGNHVIVETVNGGHLLFAHLRNIQVVVAGQPVSVGTPLGFVDDTGYSGGTHLHYEDTGSGCPRPGTDINKYLPFPVPPCGSAADCASQLKSMGHGSCL